MVWILFLLSALVIIFSGTRLVKYADILSDKLAISKVWIGAILLGLVTSMPEAMTSLAAVISFEATDLAVGNMLGSNVYNIMIIVLMDAMYRQGSITSQFKLNSSNMLSSSLAILLSLVVAGEIFLSSKIPLPGVGYVSFGCIAIAVIYLAGIKILFNVGNSRAGKAMEIPAEDAAGSDMKKIYANLLLSAALVVVGAIGLTFAGESIAQTTGLGRMFVGSIFLALATSLPEIVVSLSALRIGSFSLAIGNIFGSNMLNIFIIFLSGLFYPKGPILAAVSQTHVLTAFAGIILTCIAMIGIRLKKKRIIFGIGVDSFIMIICFIVVMQSLYRLR